MTRDRFHFSWRQFAAAMSLALTLAIPQVRSDSSAPPESAVPPVGDEQRDAIDAALQTAMAGLRQLDALDGPDTVSLAGALLAAAEIDVDGLSHRYAERHADRDASGPTIDETRALVAGGRVHVSNVAGLVRVSSWDRAEVHVGGRLGSARATLDITGNAGELDIVVRLPKQSHLSSDTLLELRVPSQARLDIETVSADLVVTGVAGPIDVDTVSGDVAMAVASRDVGVHTVSGDVRLKAPSATATRLKSVSGELELEGLSGRLALETVSGDVALDGGGRFSDVSLQSVSGDLSLELALEPAARVTGQTLSGEIHLKVLQAVAGTARLKSVSGDTRCEGAQAVDHRPGRKREFIWGDGRGASIELSSFSGDIRVERR